jgi:hypothetical protein
MKTSIPLIGGFLRIFQPIVTFAGILDRINQFKTLKPTIMKKKTFSELARINGGVQCTVAGDGFSGSITFLSWAGVRKFQSLHPDVQMDCG